MNVPMYSKYVLGPPAGLEAEIALIRDSEVDHRQQEPSASPAVQALGCGTLTAVCPAEMSFSDSSIGFC